MNIKDLIGKTIVDAWFDDDRKAINIKFNDNTEYFILSLWNEKLMIDIEDIRIFKGEDDASYLSPT